MPYYRMPYFKFVRRMRGFYFVVLPTLLLAAVVFSAYWGTHPTP